MDSVSQRAILKVRMAWSYAGSIGPELRFYIASGMVLTGIVRVLTGSNATPINYLSSEVYGALLFVLGVCLILTCGRKWRCSWGGRLAAIASTSLYLLLALDILGAPVSFSAVVLIILALGNEVRIHEC